MINWDVLKDKNFSDEFVRIVDIGIAAKTQEVRDLLLGKVSSGDLISMNFIKGIIDIKDFTKEDKIKFLYCTASLGHWQSIRDILNMFIEEPESFIGALERINSKLIISITKNSLKYRSRETIFYVIWCLTFAIGHPINYIDHAIALCQHINDNEAILSKRYPVIALFYNFLILANTKGEEYTEKYKDFINFPENIANFKYIKPFPQIRIKALHKMLLGIINGTVKLEWDLENVYIENMREAEKDYSNEIYTDRYYINSSSSIHDDFLILIRAIEASKKNRFNQNAGKNSLYKAPYEDESNPRRTIFDLIDYKYTKKWNIKRID